MVAATRLKYDGLVPQVLGMYVNKINSILVAKKLIVYYIPIHVIK